jgi:type II secretory pathway component PulJ
MTVQEKPKINIEESSNEDNMRLLLSKLNRKLDQVYLGGGDIMALAFEKKENQWTPFDIFFLKDSIEKVDRLKRSLIQNQNKLITNKSTHSDSLEYWLKRLILKSNDAIIQEQGREATEYIQLLAGMFGIEFIIKDNYFTNLILKGTENISLQQTENQKLKLQIFHTNSIDVKNVIIRKKNDSAYIELLN